MAGYVITAASCIFKKEDGSQDILYQGAVLPDFVKGDALKHLVDLGFVDKADAPAKSK